MGRPDAPGHRCHVGPARYGPRRPYHCPHKNPSQRTLAPLLSPAPPLSSLFPFQSAICPIPSSMAGSASDEIDWVGPAADSSGSSDEEELVLCIALRR